MSEAALLGWVGRALYSAGVDMQYAIIENDQSVIETCPIKDPSGKLSR